MRDSAPFTREDIVRFLEDNKIQTRMYFAGNVLLQPAYSHLMDGLEAIKRYPVATKAMKDTFFIGTSPVITEEQANYVCGAVDDFFKKEIS
jgi:CDP-6-deoxy-D-xylo-4-hexulose-3-dehydrase